MLLLLIVFKVRRCRLTVSTPVLKVDSAHRLQRLTSYISYNLLATNAFSFNLRHYVKVVSSRENTLAESRGEVRRQDRERRERLVDVRRRLAGPLRAASRDLRGRLADVLRAAPPTATGGRMAARCNYFAAHYPDDPEAEPHTPSRSLDQTFAVPSAPYCTYTRILSIFNVYRAPRRFT